LEEYGGFFVGTCLAGSRSAHREQALLRRPRREAKQAPWTAKRGEANRRKGDGAGVWSGAEREARRLGHEA